MADMREASWRQLAVWAAAATAMVAAGLTFFVLSGVYNVAASSDHFGITNKVIRLVLRRSVATHSLFVAEPPNLQNPDLIRLGAGHYGGGCQPCHGAPGQPANPIVAAMLPPPPPLQNRVEEWSDEELFWIVKNGLKFTGMPAWAAQERDDEVWTLVAFLRQMPGLTAEEYQRLARGNAPPPEPEAITSNLAALTQCSRCHGTDSAPPTSSLIPRLAGQSQAYLERALREFASGARSSGVMHPVAFELDVAAIQEFAAYYAALSGLSDEPADGGRLTETVERGREIAEHGVRKDRIPSCNSCHSGVTGSFPELAGQSAAYLAGQLALWQKGLRDETRHGAIMAPIANRLNEQQILDVTAYFENLGRSGGTGQAAR